MSNHGIDRQIILETEGAGAGLEGKTRADCPYDQATQSFEWNHWVFGCEVAAAEVETIRSGKVEWTSTSSHEVVMTLPVEEAIRTGAWKPRYAQGLIAPSSSTGETKR